MPGSAPGAGEGIRREAPEPPRDRPRDHARDGGRGLRRPAHRHHADPGFLHRDLAHPRQPAGRQPPPGHGGGRQHLQLRLRRGSALRPHGGGGERVGHRARHVRRRPGARPADQGWARNRHRRPNAIFAAITGVSVASAAVFTKVAVPEMTRLGYRPRFAVGVVAGSSVLGMLIPPSLLLILYGILSDQSIGTLFIAGIVPGILLAAVFSVGILLLAHFAPGYVGGPSGS